MFCHKQGDADRDEDDQGSNDVQGESKPATSRLSENVLNPRIRKPSCTWRIRKADVFVSIFSHRALMNFGCTLKYQEVKIHANNGLSHLHQRANVYGCLHLNERIVTRPVSVSEKWEKTGARLRLSSLCKTKKKSILFSSLISFQFLIKFSAAQAVQSPGDKSS